MDLPYFHWMASEIEGMRLKRGERVRKRTIRCIQTRRLRDLDSLSPNKDILVGSGEITSISR